MTSDITSLAFQQSILGKVHEIKVRRLNSNDPIRSLDGFRNYMNSTYAKRKNPVSTPVELIFPNTYTYKARCIRQSNNTVVYFAEHDSRLGRFRIYDDNILSISVKNGYYTHYPHIKAFLYHICNGSLSMCRKYTYMCFNNYRILVSEIMKSARILRKIYYYKFDIYDDPSNFEGTNRKKYVRTDPSDIHWHGSIFSKMLSGYPLALGDRFFSNIDACYILDKIFDKKPIGVRQNTSISRFITDSIFDSNVNLIIQSFLI